MFAFGNRYPHRCHDVSVRHPCHLTNVVVGQSAPLKFLNASRRVKPRLLVRVFVGCVPGGEIERRTLRVSVSVPHASQLRRWSSIEAFEIFQPTFKSDALHRFLAVHQRQPNATVLRIGTSQTDVVQNGIAQVCGRLTDRPCRRLRCVYFRASVRNAANPTRVAAGLTEQPQGVVPVMPRSTQRKRGSVSSACNCLNSVGENVPGCASSGTIGKGTRPWQSRISGIAAITVNQRVRCWVEGTTSEIY